MSNKKVVLTIDVLINNASRFRYGFIGELTPEDWDFTVRNVLYSCFNFSNEVSKVFKKNRSGKIINIGSINGLRGREGNLAYSSAKAGMIGLTKSIAKELGPYNVTANVIAPGFINTERHANIDEAMKRKILDECFIKKLSEPIEVANLVLFLASDQANNITGQVYQIDCGQYI
ncbi:SDR family NAD(P)-dependent oxidoreductase [uncultured Methanobrevibacter sp.]|uniref:SDR family NAD(P)-dependent oxidoreductase n=1 Tax=uncultured Methanobrevibacter sp. TaxID=253161 RepID=UPI0025CD881D|nr:SDR family NAD(P)-dependent oxidoreductase [uncultured Methanobrevibacter sp.]